MKTDTIKAIIVDDEQRCIANLSYYLSKYCPSIEVVATSNTITGAIDLLLHHKPDVAFMDIEICNDCIFSIINNSEKLNYEIVFVTAYEQYAVKAIKVDALDYILKPLSKSDILECYEKILKRLQNRHIIDSYHPEQTDVSRKVILKQGEQVFVVKQSDIYYFKAKGFYTEVFFDYKGEVFSILISKPVSTIEKEYDNNLYFRLHKSYLVNTKKIISVIKGEHVAVKLINNESLPVAKRRINDLLSFLNKED